MKPGRAETAAFLTLCLVACGGPTGLDLGGADVLGEVISVEVAFDVVGPNQTLGRVVVRDLKLDCDVSVRLLGATRVRDGESAIGLIQIRPGQLVQSWTVTPATCGVALDAIEVRLGGRAQARTTGGAT